MAGFVLTFSRPLGYSGYISYSVSGTATNGTDYYSVSGGGYFSGWESQTTVYFDFTPYVFDDSTYEGDETLTLTVEPPSGGEYQVDPTANTATITIYDNEQPPPTVSISGVTVEEGDTAYFVVSLSQALDHDVTIYYTTVDETANAADYTPVSGSVTIAAGSTDAVIAVETIYNRADAVAETFRLDYCTQDQSVVCAAPATGTITVAGPWSRGEWKLVGDVYQGVAYAASRYNTLSELAESITGDWMDASLLAPVEGGIVIGTVVDISPLLQKFEDRLRTNIVAAAGAPKAATFPGENDEFSIGDGMKEAAVNAVFQTPGATLPVLDCRGMARVVMAYGLIETLYSWYDTPADRQSKHYFDRLGLDPKILFDSYTSQRRGPLEEMKAGDLIGFRNRTGYENLHRRGAYGALNTIKTGDDAFYCWNDGTRTEAGSCQLLCDKYNEGIEQKINLDQVPGYVGYAFFVNVPRICAKVFDLRTSQTTAT